MIVRRGRAGGAGQSPATARYASRFTKAAWCGSAGMLTGWAIASALIPGGGLIVILWLDRQRTRIGRGHLHVIHGLGSPGSKTDGQSKRQAARDYKIPMNAIS
jgi:hypothetical protein